MLLFHSQAPHCTVIQPEVPAFRRESTFILLQDQDEDASNEMLA